MAKLGFLKDPESQENYFPYTITDAILDFDNKVKSTIQQVVGAAPEALDTLEEIADALNNDANLYTTLTNLIDTKIDTNLNTKVNKSGDTMSGNLTAPKFITSGGTANQVVLGNGNLQNINSLSTYEAFLQWGGKNFSGGSGPLDAALIPTLGADRFAFGNIAGVAIYHSTDGGATWNDYGATDTQKKRLFSDVGSDLYINKSKTYNVDFSNLLLKIIVRSDQFSVYSTLNKFAIYLSTNGTGNCWCTIRKRTQQNYIDNVDTWITVANKVPVSGWSGWNIINVPTIITYGYQPTTQFGEIEFTFGGTGSNANYLGLFIQKIKAFGGVGWTCPSNMARVGSLYRADEDQNAIFPANITSAKFIKSGGSSSQFLKADGSIDSNTYLTTHQSVTNNNPTLQWGQTSVIGKVGNTNLQVTLPANPNTDTDTKDTAGSSNTSNKIFLVGATAQVTNARTYSHDTVYVDTDGCLYSNSKKVALAEDLTTLTDLVYSIHYQPTFTISPNVVFKGTATTVTATAKLAFNGTEEETFHASTPSTPSEWTVGTTSGKTRTFTLSLNTTANSTEVATTISKDSYSKEMKTTIAAVNHIYYGQSSSDSYKSLSGLTKYTSATTTAKNRNYTVNMTAGNYFYIAVPSNVAQPSQVGTGGAGGFFADLVTVGTATATDGSSDTYTFYRTDSTQAAGSWSYYCK